MSLISRPSNILDPGLCLTLRPMVYPEFFDMYRNAVKNTWSVEEVDFSTDVQDLAHKMTDSERHLINRLVAFFATGDSIVSNNLVLNLYKHINAPEARMYLSRQLYEEALHVQFYLTLLDTYVPDPKARNDAFSAVENIPSIRHKADFCMRWLNSISEIDKLRTKGDRKQFLLNLICFAACIEGLFFFGAFAYVYSLRSRGLMQGLASGTNWVFRDESCVDPSTEVLTPSGWVAFPNLREGDKVVQYDQRTGETSFVVPSRILRKNYIGKMVHLFHEKGGVDQFLTADHDVVQKWDHQHAYSKQKAADFVPNGKKLIPVSGPVRNDRSETRLTPYERFLVALQADGTLPPDVRNGKFCGTVPVTFTLKKRRKTQRLESILKDLLWSYKVSVSPREASIYRVSVPSEIFLSKSFSSWIDLESRSLAWLSDFVEEITHWDGHFPKSGKYRQYISSVEENADFVQAAAALCGFHCLKSRRVDGRKESYKDIFNCYTKERSHVRCMTLNKEVSDYDGTVYCVSVPTGAFLIRRNGKVSVTGNCHMNFAFQVVNTVRREDPGLFDSVLAKDVVTMLEEAVACETQFAEDMLSGGVIGLSTGDVRRYLEYCADQRLSSLELPRRFGAKNPFSFLDSQDVQEVTNFFERRPSAYQTGVEGAVKLDDEF